MDGGAFKARDDSVEAAGEVADTPLAVAMPALEVFPPAGQVAAAADERRRYLNCLGVAAAGHLLLLAATLPHKGHEAPGDGGQALEAIAVSLVDAVPSHAVPQSAPAEAAVAQVDADGAQAETAPQTAPPQPDKAADAPEPPRQALALDLPPETVPPDAIALPVREREAKPDPEPLVREEKPAESKPEKPAAVAPSQAQVAAAAMPAQSAAEASPGVARVYAGQVSQVLDRNKPRSRGMRGRVHVQFVVDAAGRSQPPLVLASSGNTHLDAMVVDAIQRMEFPRPPAEMSERQRTFNVPFAFR